MEKPEDGCFQFVKDDLSVRVEKHPASSSQMSNFRTVSLSQQPGEECCCGSVMRRKHNQSSVCLLLNLPRHLFFQRLNHLLQPRVTFVGICKLLCPARSFLGMLKCVLAPTRAEMEKKTSSVEITSSRLSSAFKWRNQVGSVGH